MTAEATTARPGQAAVPAGSVVYAVGDIHGRCDLLRALHAQIVEHARDRKAMRRVVVYLGDYIDRGADSMGVIGLLIDAPLAGFEHVHLIGNHERLMLDFLRDASVGPTWILNGGDRTLASYGVVAAGQALWLPSAALKPLQSELRDRLPARHRAFLERLRFSHREGGYCFVHAGVRPGVALDAQDEEDLLWIREPFLSSPADFGAVIVHGHTIVAAPENLVNRVGIDTGAWYSNRLTALVLEGTKRRWLQT